MQNKEWEIGNEEMGNDRLLNGVNCCIGSIASDGVRERMFSVTRV